MGRADIDWTLSIAIITGEYWFMGGASFEMAIFHTETVIF
jgi:hypothetical protein